MNSQPQSRTNERSDEQLRSLTRASYPEYVDRWALVVGISTYEHEQLNLKYADRDALEFHKLIQTPSGGGFKADHIEKLIDEDATTTNVTRALRSFLKKPAPNDMVVIYLACHGAPDPDRPNNVYLLTYDADPADISGTALPMREIELSLEENLLAERVVILADTCHSAAIGGSEGRRSVPSAAVVNNYLKKLTESQDGIALLTSAEATEVSREDDRWGGGHGVFTYCLLEGMRGNADRQPRDGVVTVGELFEYVREKVQLETNYQQHPFIGPKPYDRNLPMAVTGDISAREHYQLGCQLYELGWALDDKRRFQSATRHLNDAIRLSRSAGGEYPEADLQVGLNLLAMGEHDGAIIAFKRAASPKGADGIHEAHRLLGIVYAKMGDFEAAVDAFETFLRQPVRDGEAAWVKEYLGWLEGKKTAGKYALLIGIGEYVDPALAPLQGPENDIRAMDEVLRDRYGFQNITVLRDAARRRILGALKDLGKKVTRFDTVVVYFSGHSLSEDSGPYLLPHDTALDSGKVRNAIRGKELHHEMNNIGTEYKTLILDTHPNTAFLNLVQPDASYAVLLASSPGQQTFERLVDQDGVSQVYGAFTHSLVVILSAANPKEVTFRKLVAPLGEQIRDKGFEQTPLFVGMRDQHLLADVDLYSSAFDFAQRRNYASMTLEDVSRLYAAFHKQITALTPGMLYSFGRAFLEKKSYSRAIKALQDATDLQGDYLDARMLLGFAQIGAQRYSEALTSFRTCLTSPKTPEVARKIEEIISLCETLQCGRRHALLVGINDYMSPDVPNLRGAVNDVLGLKDVLCSRFGFEEENVKVLLDHEATRRNMIEAFSQLVQKADTEPALFYFAGCGSTDAYNGNDAPTLVSADGRLPEVFDVELQELADLASSQEELDLVTIIDAGWTGDLVSEAGRTVPSDRRPKPSTRAVRLALVHRDLSNYRMQIGRMSIYSETITIAGGALPQEAELEFTDSRGHMSKKRWHGKLTHALIGGLKAAKPESATFSQLLERMKSSVELLVRGDYADQGIFSYSVLRNKAFRYLKEFDRGSTKQTIGHLRRLIEQRGGVYAEAFLDLGIAYAVRGDYPESIKALEEAIAQRKDGHYPEARYYLGRVLLESGSDLAQAVSELRQVTQQEPDNVAAFYYLGQAIQSLVQRETLAEAAETLRRYLDKGAPLGHEDEIQRFLDSRRKGTR